MDIYTTITLDIVLFACPCFDSVYNARAAADLCDSPVAVQPVRGYPQEGHGGQGVGVLREEEGGGRRRSV